MEQDFLLAAIKLAEEALSVNEVPIGCVIVDEEGRILASGRNRTNELRNATRHAEFEALDKLFQDYLTKEERCDEQKIRSLCSKLRLFVTVEPCIMCAAALRRIGLTQVYFGCYNDRFGGCGSIIPVHEAYIPHHIDPPLICTLLKQHRRDCVTLLRKFYLLQNNRAPLPRKKSRRLLKPVSDAEDEKQNEI